MDGYGGKDFEKRKVSRGKWKKQQEMSTTCRGSEPEDGQEPGDNDATVCENTKINRKNYSKSELQDADNCDL